MSEKQPSILEKDGVVQPNPKAQAVAHRASFIQSITAPLRRFSRKESRSASKSSPDEVKQYSSCPGLCIRVFYPTSHTRGSRPLSTLFTIYGGDLLSGSNSDDDEWNRYFADSQVCLVIALDYPTAPASRFPDGLYALQTLFMETLADDSLPIDDFSDDRGYSRTAIVGFSAGANLALALSQLENVRRHSLTPAAAVSVYGWTDFSVEPQKKMQNRPFKPSLSSPRGSKEDVFLYSSQASQESRVLGDNDLQDSLLSPDFATVDRLPPYVFCVGAELDVLAHGSWRLATRLSNEATSSVMQRRVPEWDDEDSVGRICGREKPASEGVILEGLESGKPNERFAFEDTWESGGVKWLLVPDVVHGFDHPRLAKALGSSDETLQDAELKTKAYVAELGRWLKEVVWQC